MRHRPLVLLLSLPLLAGCAPDEGTAAKTKPDPQAMVETMRLATADLLARPEHDVQKVEIQNILVSFAGSPAGEGVTRVRPDAETLAAELYARIVDGEDMGDLMREYSDDPGAGIYTLSNGQTLPGEQPRGTTVALVADVAWRLEVGEVGVAPYDPKRCPFGWHVVKRLR